MIMVRNIFQGAEQGEEDDRRMNAYLSGIESVADDNEEEGEERSPRRRKSRTPRRMKYEV
jgi:hypothetical protein